MSRGRRPGRARLLAVLLLTLLAASPAAGQVIIKAADDVSFRLGFLLQGWSDWTQDQISGGYGQNLFLRRIRFNLTAALGQNVVTFFQTDSPRLGNAGATGAKVISTGFLVQDAFIEWKLVGEKLMLDGGLFYTPQSRAVLTSSSASLADVPAFGQQQVSLTGSSSGRDVGFGVKGYLFGDRLEYRAGAFSGQRQASAAGSGAAGSRNSFRAAGRLQFEFLDTEKGYTYTGTNRGIRKILVVGAWGDTQGDFEAWGADVFADIPIGKDAVTAEFDYLFYDGGKQFQQVVGGVAKPLLPRQEDFFTQAGYFFHAVGLQPFVRYEHLRFRDDRFQTSDEERYGTGFNWYVFGQNLKITPFWERLAPKVAAAGALVKDTNHFVVQVQVYY